MSSLIRRPGSIFPTIVSDFFDGDRFFDNDLRDWTADLLKPTLKLRTAVPAANVTENDKNFLVEMAVPGMDKKDFKVEVENNRLSISAEKEEKKEEKDNGNLRKEYSYNSFCRSFNLPENSITDKITSKYENGILRVEIPKKEVSVSKPTKQITVA